MSDLEQLLVVIAFLGYLLGAVSTMTLLAMEGLFAKHPRTERVCVMLSVVWPLTWVFWVVRFTALTVINRALPGKQRAR